MDFNLLLADLRGAAQQYCQKISDKYAATVAYCEVACKVSDLRCQIICLTGANLSFILECH